MNIEKRNRWILGGPPEQGQSPMSRARDLRARPSRHETVSSRTARRLRPAAETDPLDHHPLPANFECELRDLVLPKRPYLIIRSRLESRPPGLSSRAK